MEFNRYEIAGEYEDVGKSRKSIEGRSEFNRMMEDIKTGKDDVSFVLPECVTCTFSRRLLLFLAVCQQAFSASGLTMPRNDFGGHSSRGGSSKFGNPGL